MTACGQTRTHLPHWMQSSASHTGTSVAIARFSHCAVPLGIGAVGGEGADRQRITLTGDERPGHVLDECRRFGGHGRRPLDATRRRLGHGTSCRCASAASTAAQFRLDDGLAALAVGLLDRVL